MDRSREGRIRIAKVLFNRSLIFVAAALLALSGGNAVLARDAIRIGVPTKTFWPTIIAQTAIDKKLFEKEGLKAELTIYRGGGEAFEALAAKCGRHGPRGAVVCRRRPPQGRRCQNRGGRWHPLFRLASGGAEELEDITKFEELAGKKVAITSTGSSSDIAARWFIQNKKVQITPVPLGGGGLVPNLLSGNVEAVVLNSPLTFELLKSGEIRSMLDFSKEMPEHLATGWITIQVHRQQAASGAENAERAVRQPGLPAQKSRRGDQDNRYHRRDKAGDRRRGIRQDDYGARTRGRDDPRAR